MHSIGNIIPLSAFSKAYLMPHFPRYILLEIIKISILHFLGLFVISDAALLFCVSMKASKARNGNADD